MVSEAIERVRAVEASAEARRRTASAEAKKLLVDAREASDIALDDMRKEVRAREADLLEEARSAARNEAEGIKKDSGTAVDAVRAGAEVKVAVGVSLVLESISAEAS